MNPLDLFSCITIILHSLIASSSTKNYCISTEYNNKHILYPSTALQLVELSCLIIIIKITYDNESLGKFFSCITIIPHSLTAPSYTGGEELELECEENDDTNSNYNSWNSGISEEDEQESSSQTRSQPNLEVDQLEMAQQSP